MLKSMQSAPIKDQPSIPIVDSSKNIESSLTDEIGKSGTIIALINKLSKVKNIKSSDGKNIDTRDIVILLEDLMMTNKVADLESKLTQFEKYFTRNYGLRDKVKQLVQERISKRKKQKE